tara:strand:- start:182 stop:373 length:192 start_codon:yes stop_codon:yes gene_type:complete
MNNYKNKKNNFEKISYKIKVTAKDTGRVMVHKNVPHDHLEMIRVNPNLEVKVLEVYNKAFSRK